MSSIFAVDNIPAETLESIKAYVAQGRPVGDFLRACLSNNLFRAVGYADDRNLKALPAIVHFLVNKTPLACWGNDATYRSWLETKRAEREAGEKVGSEG